MALSIIESFRGNVPSEFNGTGLINWTTKNEGNWLAFKPCEKNNNYTFHLLSKHWIWVFFTMHNFVIIVNLFSINKPLLILKELSNCHNSLDTSDCFPLLQINYYWEASDMLLHFNFKIKICFLRCFFYFHFNAIGLYLKVGVIETCRKGLQASVIR